jgi:N-acetylneuraminic acid mutarotase
LEKPATFPLYSAGGKIIGPTNPQSRGDGRIYSSAVWSYRPGAESWERQPEMRNWQCWGAAWSYQGELLLIGGAHRDTSAGAYLFDSRMFALR